MVVFREDRRDHRIEQPSSRRKKNVMNEMEKMAITDESSSRLMTDEKIGWRNLDVDNLFERQRQPVRRAEKVLSGREERLQVVPHPGRWVR